jgi:cytochrome c-type biogenesis protein CcmE
MNSVKYWVGALLVVGALGYLALSGAQENMVNYLTIAEVKASTDTEAATGVRVAGRVKPGSIDPSIPREVVFTVAGEGDSLRARYRGVVPDTFKDGAEVVLEGKLNGRGEFEATTLLAKCPSKYEAQGDAHPEQVPVDGTTPTGY